MPAPSDVVLSDVSGATTLEMSETSSSALVTQLNEAAKTWPFWPWCLALTVVLIPLTPLVCLAGLPLTVWLFLQDRVRRTAVAFYDVHGADEARKFQHLVDSFARACQAERAWHVVAAGAVKTTHQHKINAGASSLVNRLPLARRLGGPAHLKTNIAVPSLLTSKRSVYLLPDRILVRNGRHYADVPYGHIQTTATPQRFIEDGHVPADSTLLGHTWRYVNVKGGPDRRFKDNRQLPILEYGRLTVTGGSGFTAIFDFSTPSASDALHGALRGMAVEPRRAAPRPEAVRVMPAPAQRMHQPQKVAATRQGAPRPAFPPTGAVSLPRRRLSADGRIAVVGEAHYQPGLQRAAGGAVAGQEFSRHLPVTAMLVPEPDNPHDAHAVRVDVVMGAGAETVGYLSRADAPDYQPALLACRQQGHIGTCPARITGGGPGRNYGIYLHLATPEALLLENLKDDADLLEADRQVTVTREEAHQETLARYHATPRPFTRVAADLVPSRVSRGKHQGSFAIEVQLDGDRVGELTATMSARYEHLVAAVARARCEAVITHGERGFQIDLRLPKIT